VVGRNEEDNQKIETFSQAGDVLLKTVGYPGPVSLLRGEADGTEMERAASITARYSKAKGIEKGEVQYRKVGREEEKSIFVSPLSEAEIQKGMISE